TLRRRRPAIAGVLPPTAPAARLPAALPLLGGSLRLSQTTSAIPRRTSKFATPSGMPPGTVPADIPLHHCLSLIITPGRCPLLPVRSTATAAARSATTEPSQQHSHPSSHCRTCRRL